METPAGRIVANEPYCIVEEGGFTALDEAGRQRLPDVCLDSYTQCKKTPPEEEAQQLLCRVQAIAKHPLPQPDTEQTKGWPTVRDTKYPATMV